jgi:hypothetical protein
MMEDRNYKVHSSFEFDFACERGAVVTGISVTLNASHSSFGTNREYGSISCAKSPNVGQILANLVVCLKAS